MNSGNPFSLTAVDFTVLDLRGDISEVLRSAGAQAPLRREFPLGVDSLVRQCLRHEPPLPIELEQAIDVTEEAVMPMAAQFAGNPALILQGLGASLIASRLQASGQAQTVLTLDDVETLFNRLVSVSQGRPASQEALPADARFVAAMLILREFMHHLHFAQVTLQTSWWKELCEGRRPIGGIQRTGGGTAATHRRLSVRPDSSEPLVQW
jgi:exopolyphosphatase/pppGpp-phosphohydrolase